MNNPLGLDTKQSSIGRDNSLRLLADIGRSRRSKIFDNISDSRKLKKRETRQSKLSSGNGRCRSDTEIERGTYR